MGIRHNGWQAAMFLAILAIPFNALAQAREQPGGTEQKISASGSEIQTEALRITVRTFDYANLTGHAAREMITEAGLIFLKAGIETLWINCRNHEQNEEDLKICENPLAQTDVVLRILPGEIPQSARLPETALGYAVIREDGGSMATVYLRRIENIAQGSPATRGQVLGHAAAHEIGHLLLGTLEHSPRGIMKANWKGKILDDIARRGMVFNRQQAGRMQKQVHERQRYSDELLNAGVR